MTPRDSCPECGRSVTEALNRFQILGRVPTPHRKKVSGVVLLVSGFIGAFCLLVLAQITGWSALSSTFLLLAAFFVAAVFLGSLLLLLRAHPGCFAVYRGFKCTVCGYQLRGTTSDRCPECGSWFSPSSARSHVPPDA
jgi:hypothetical protein